MDGREHSQLNSLHSWLEVATRGLCAESRQRIRTEIESHFAEAVEDLTAAGCREDDAGRAALDGLGDARLAAREFRRHHLTKLEAGLLKDVGRRPPRYRLLLWSALAALTLAGSAYRIDSPAEVKAFVATALLLFASVGLHFWLAPALHARQRHKTALVIDFTSTWVFFTAIVLGSSFISSGLDKILSSILIQGGALALLLILLIPLLRGARKLPKKPV